MAAEDGKVFKNSLFGGFNRDDVLAYIESFSKQSEQEKSALRAENEKIKAQLDELTRANQELTAQKEEALSNLAGMEEELQTVQSEAEAQRDIVDGAGRAAAELQAFRAKVAELEEIAELYKKDKNNVASIELMAYRRAQDIEKKAKNHAEKILTGLSEVTNGVVSRYDGLKTDISSGLSHAIKEIDAIRAQMQDIGRLFEESNAKLEELKIKGAAGSDTILRCASAEGRQDE